MDIFDALDKQLYPACGRHFGAEKLNTWSDFVQHVNCDVICGDNTDFGWTVDEINKYATVIWSVQPLSQKFMSQLLCLEICVAQI